VGLGFHLFEVLGTHHSLILRAYAPNIHTLRTGLVVYSYPGLEGPVLRLFRGDWNLKVGDRASARLYIFSEELMAIPGGWIGILPDTLTAARHIEAYIDDQPPWEPLGQYDYTFLENGPTDMPAMSIDQLEQALVEYENIFLPPGRAPDKKGRLRQAEGAGPVANVFDYLLRKQAELRF
jgi:hypothetical protein